MEIIVSRVVVLEGEPRNSRTVTKSYESNVIPRKGDYFESSAFHRDDEVLVLSITINYEQGYCYIGLNPHVLKSTDLNDLKRFVDMYITHEWECGFYGFDNEE